jgi:DNA-binding MarR family transcriptional regulator
VAEKKQAAEIFSDIVDIVRAVRSNRKIEIFRGGMEKMNLAQMTAMYFLYEAEAGMTMGELAKAAAVKMPTMTETMTPLVKAGHVIREHDEKDRRIVKVKLSAKGMTLVGYNRKVGIDYIGKYLSKLNHIERKIAGIVVKRTKEVLLKRFER